VIVADAETTQPISYLDCETLSMRIPEPPEEPAGHRAPGVAQRLRETARKAVRGVRRRSHWVVTAWDRVWPPMLGVFTGLTIWLLMVWVLWEAFII
jgi:hypothetical protein